MKRKQRRLSRRTERLLAVVVLFLRRSRPVPLEDVQLAARCSERNAYRLVASLVEAGLIRRHEPRGWTLRKTLTR